MAARSSSSVELKRHRSLCAAARFLREGARVVALGLSGPTVASAQEVLGSSALVLGGNATLSDTVPKAIAAAMRTFGRFDALYHVAGGSGARVGDGALHDVSDEAWRATHRLTLMSAFLSNPAAVRQFLTQRGGGAILNMGRCPRIVAIAPPFLDPRVRHGEGCD